jgi:hypothetical protein
MDPPARLLALLKIDPSLLHAAYRVGSRVYGTAGPASDEDFVAILSRPGQKQDLAFGDRINVVLHGIETFQAALADQSVFALECLFAPPEHVLKPPRPPFRHQLDRKKLIASATNRSTSDWQKAKKTFLEEPAPARKKLFHALRVPMFALQIAQTGKLTDYTAANHFHAEIQRGPDDDFGYYADKFGPVRDALCADLAKLAGKR